MPAPTARADLEVNEVEDGLVVYDTGAERVHYLNRTASLVFLLCTGDNTEAVIAEQLGQAFGEPEKAPAAVAECLTSLRDQGLLAAG